MALSEEKIKRLFAICHANAWTNDQLKAYLKFRYKIDRTHELTESNYQFLCQIIATTTPEMAMFTGEE